MPYSMSRKIFVRQNAWIIARKPANGSPAMQLLKKKQKKKQTTKAWKVGR